MTTGIKKTSLSFIFSLAFIAPFLNPYQSFGEKQYFDLLLVKTEEGKLTISREPVTSEEENSALKLNVDALRKKGIFSVHQPGKWCRDILIHNAGYVRVAIKVSNSNLNDADKDPLPMTLVVAVRGRTMVNRIFGIDKNNKKPLNKVVINGYRGQVELQKEDEKPEIINFEPVKYDYPLSDLLIREEEESTSCFKKYWMEDRSKNNKHYDDESTP